MTKVGHGSPSPSQGLHDIGAESPTLHSLSSQNPDVRNPKSPAYNAWRILDLLRAANARIAYTRTDIYVSINDRVSVGRCGMAMINAKRARPWTSVRKITRCAVHQPQLEIKQNSTSTHLVVIGAGRAAPDGERRLWRGLRARGGVGGTGGYGWRWHLGFASGLTAGLGGWS